MAGSNGRGQQSESTKLRKIEDEKRSRNCSLISITILVMGIMGFIYMMDLNTIVTSFIAGIVAVLYNGVGSLMGWEQIIPAVIASSLKTVLLAVFVGSFGLAWFVNKQNR